MPLACIAHVQYATCHTLICTNLFLAHRHLLPVFFSPRLNSQVPTIDSRLTDVEDDITVLDMSLLNHENLLRSTQSNLTTLQGQTNGLVTSVNNINGRLTTLVNVYQNCREDTSVCNIMTLRDTRLFCSTSALLKNLEVSRLITYTLLNGVHVT